MGGFLGLKELSDEVWAVKVLLRLPCVILTATTDNGLGLHTGTTHKAPDTRASRNAEKSSRMMVSSPHGTGQGCQGPGQAFPFSGKETQLILPSRLFHTPLKGWKPH